MIPSIAQQPPHTTSDGVALLDYCLLPYKVDLADDALDSRTLLYAAGERMGVADELLTVVSGLQAKLGVHQTVWGVSRDAATGALAVELYFYRRPHSPADLSLLTVADALAPTVRLAQTHASGFAWHMFSVELGPTHLRGEVAVSPTIYSAVTGMSYALTAAGPVLENHYDFHHPQRDIDRILEQLSASVHCADSAANLVARLPPQLLDCYHVCVAQKRSADAVYFSRIQAAQLGWFLQKHGWPTAWVAALKSAPRFAHIRWDVGASYQRDGATLRWPKSGFYASF